MNAIFSRAVDPIFLQVFGLLERIARKERIRLEDERNAIRACFSTADGTLGNIPDWELAKYALVCWIDEVLIDIQWEHRGKWRENVLEIEYFNSRDRAWKFYVNAEAAARLPQRDALETYYVCAVLGFQGLYRPPQNADEQPQGPSFDIQQYHLPPDREAWARQRAVAIQLGKDRPPIAENAEAIEGAPPLTGPEAVVWPALAALMLATAGAVLAYLFALPLPWR